jgi:hypothetical protein
MKASKKTVKLPQFAVIHENHIHSSSSSSIYELQLPPSGGSEITHKDAPQSLRLLWTSDQPVAETST